MVLERAIECQLYVSSTCAYAYQGSRSARPGPRLGFEKRRRRKMRREVGRERSMSLNVVYLEQLSFQNEEEEADGMGMEMESGVDRLT